jgi:hypothetical protein
MKESIAGTARQHFGSAGLASAIALCCNTAFAQELEEVVVTAQKRAQNVQNVPIAISAYTAETLQSKGIGDIGALTRLAPNVNLDTGSPFSGDTSVLSASIRGIGQDDFAFNLDPGVGVYLDGAPAAPRRRRLSCFVGASRSYPTEPSGNHETTHELCNDPATHVTRCHPRGPRRLRRGIFRRRADACTARGGHDWRYGVGSDRQPGPAQQRGR